MLLNLHKKSWMEGLNLKDYNEHCQENESTVKTMLELVKNYHKVSIVLFGLLQKEICNPPVEDVNGKFQGVEKKSLERRYAKILEVMVKSTRNPVRSTPKKSILLISKFNLSARIFFFSDTRYSRFN